MPTSTSKKNQEKAPICAAFVKQMRDVFGEEQVKVLWVKEGKFEIGAPSELDSAVSA